MKTKRLIGYSALLGSSLVLLGAVFVQDPDPNRPLPIPDNTYALKVQLVEARRFAIGEEMIHRWRADGLKYDSGWLLVLKASPALFYPRQRMEPVLYVGSQTADRFNSSVESGHIVAIVPGDFLLTDTPIFFSEPALPEELFQAQLDLALARAKAADVKPPSMAEVAAAIAHPEPLKVADGYQLHQKAVDLVEKYSPQETDFIRGKRVPLVR